MTNKSPPTMTNKVNRLSRSYTMNIAFPPKCTTSKNVDGVNSAMFMLDANLGNIFQSEGSRATTKALKHRFDRLPIHKICSDQSYHPSKIVLKKLEKAITPSREWRFLRSCNRATETGKQKDCLGMTPLHILACSTKHDLELYRLLIGKYPENLITKDEWGDIPLLYAFWGNAPQEVVQLLVERHQTLFPDHAMDWAGMVETLGRAPYVPGRASASLVCIENVLDTQQTAFPDDHVNWQQIVAKWASEDTNRATDREAQKFHRDAFKYLITFSISERLNSLGVLKWRKEILSDIDRLRWFVRYRKNSTQLIYSKLAHYEHMDQLREASSLLELALWKASIDLSMSNDQDRERESFRKKTNIGVCRIRCGADIVVPNVLHFLLPS